jgi:hypothetical protein
MRPGHFWICKFGTVPGSMTCVQRKFELQGSKCKWEEYKGTRYSDGDSALVVELWLHRVADDMSGLAFQEWDPSAGTDDTSAPVEMLVNSSELRAAELGFSLIKQCIFQRLAPRLVANRHSFTHPPMTSTVSSFGKT